VRSGGRNASGTVAGELRSFAEGGANGGREARATAPETRRKAD